MNVKLLLTWKTSSFDINLLIMFQIPWGISHRAQRTFPPQFRMGWSSIAGAGMGVFAKTFIKKHTWLAEYEGRLIEHVDGKTPRDIVRDYSWGVSGLWPIAYGIR